MPSPAQSKHPSYALLTAPHVCCVRASLRSKCTRATPGLWLSHQLCCLRCIAPAGRLGRWPQRRPRRGPCPRLTQTQGQGNAAQQRAHTEYTEGQVWKQGMKLFHNTDKLAHRESNKQTPSAILSTKGACQANKPTSRYSHAAVQKKLW